ncbi:MAG: insulinase family protein, partial [Brevundimonas sp.]|nr:insulinase family protein [Brevundimonas sp.]
MRSARLFLLAATYFALLMTASPALAQAQVQPSDPWAQAASDIPADSNVRFGLLPNGMQYAVLRNATPAGQASLRLRIDAGALMENEDQKGLAHFMEHMAFNGTTNIPENDLLRILERLGLAFG